MPDHPKIHHRRSIRLKNYDYSQPGHYFVTICTHGKRLVFGEVRDREMALSQAGEIACGIWMSIPGWFSNVQLGEWVFMPNHMHGVLIVGATFMAPQGVRRDSRGGVINPAPTLGELVRRFKAISTVRVRKQGVKSFAWQRNYYEHVIRHDESLNGIRAYIRDNPAKWDLDPENPFRRKG